MRIIHIDVRSISIVTFLPGDTLAFPLAILTVMHFASTFANVRAVPRRFLSLFAFFLSFVRSRLRAYRCMRSDPMHLLFAPASRAHPSPRDARAVHAYLSSVSRYLDLSYTRLPLSCR